MDLREKESPPEQEGDKMELTIHSNNLHKDISFYANVQDKKPQTANILQVLEGIKNGEHKAEITAYRDALLLGLDNASEMKRALPGVTFAGAFSNNGRKAGNLITFSGVICIDYDHVDNVAQLKAEAAKIPHTLAAFISPSGDGLKVLVAVDCVPEAYKGCFNALVDSLYNFEGLDKQASDISRLCFLTDDPEIFINPAAQPFQYLEAPAKAKAEINPMPSIASDATFSELVSNAKIKWIEGNRNFEIHRLAGWCKRAGIGLKEAERLIFNYARDMNSFDGLPDMPKNEVVPSVRSAYNHAPEEFGIYKASILNKTFAEIQRRAEGMGLIINKLTQKTELPDGSEMDDYQVNGFYISCGNIRGSSKEKVWSVLNSPLMPSYHPFESYLNHIATISREEYAGTLQRFLDCIELDPEYHKEPEQFKRRIIAKWVGSIVGTLCGSYSVMALVLMGPQGSGKTSFFRWLLPTALQRYYANGRVRNDKDFWDLMCNSLIINDDEFSTATKTDVEVFKQLISAQSFEYRPAYGRVIERRRRVAILCGSSNNREAIGDHTGNRRILATNILRIDHAALATVNRDFLFAELLERQKASPEWWHLSSDDVALLNNETAGNVAVNIEAEMVAVYTKPSETHYSTTSEILIHLQNVGLKNVGVKRLGAALKDRYGARRSLQMEGRVIKGYPCEKAYRYDQMEP